MKWPEVLSHFQKWKFIRVVGCDDGSNIYLYRVTNAAGGSRHVPIRVEDYHVCKNIATYVGSGRGYMY